MTRTDIDNEPTMVHNEVAIFAAPLCFGIAVDVVVEAVVAF